MVMVGAFVGALALLALSTFTSWPVGGGGGGGVLGGLAEEPVNPAYDSQAGDCLDWQRSDLSDITKVDCAAQHRFEVSGVVDIGSAFGPQAPFPGDEQWQQISQQHCTQVSLDYLGGKFDPFGKYTVGPLNPGERRWSEGQRTLRCGLQVAGPAGGLFPSFGSARTQDQSDVYDPGVCLGINGKSVGDPVDCAQPHTFEIVGVVNLGQASQEFPSPERQDEVMAGECDRIAAEYSGGADFGAKGLIVTWDTRAAESWAVGSKLANCKVGAVPAADGLTAWNGSVRNPNAPPLTTSNPPQTTAVQQEDATGAPLHPGSSSAESGSSAPPSSSSVVPTTSASVEPTE
ncbi:hypothetical protein GCM10010185_05790 [Saccharothrix coeruleofusca]|uniref:Septum formation-related domain-containing protein n=2 Tax=Saccharothrix coeruleofusca TaxID=33919 RepID=A0A918EBP3_9PSEU|nr:hypothetical protein [Saccharothrix coeruleofusca]GGP37279.1 hypothetical protein GCM10010185_05790 [Saccharothrix coeruleofusca]